VKLHPFADFKGVGKPVLGDAPTFGNIADDLGIILRIEAQQRAVVRRDRMDHREGGFAVAVVRRRRAAHRKNQLAATARRWRLGRHQPGSDEKHQQDSGHHHNLSPTISGLVRLHGTSL